HRLVLQDGQVQETSFWKLELRDPPPGGPTRWAEELRSLFFDAVRLRLRSDVPVGTLLSGGLDSSSIVCAASRLLADAGQPPPLTFSSCFEDRRYDEREYIEEVVAQTGARSHYFFPGERGLQD